MQCLGEVTFGKDPREASKRAVRSSTWRARAKTLRLNTSGMSEEKGDVSGARQARGQVNWYKTKGYKGQKKFKVCLLYFVFLATMTSLGMGQWHEHEGNSLSDPQPVCHHEERKDKAKIEDSETQRWRVGFGMLSPKSLISQCLGVWGPINSSFWLKYYLIS